jgi:hypothetical protein
MSAALWIEAGRFFVDPCPDQIRPEPKSCDVWSELSLPLPLPEAQVAKLRRIAKRMNDPCTGVPSGVIAVFTGSDAAGKLMAAEALAYEMQRVLYRVDLNEVGLAEEPHFARILNTAKAQDAILMLGNADGLPISMIQFLKGYPGLSILTTDSPREISTMLYKAAHCVVDFPFPAEYE